MISRGSGSSACVDTISAPSALPCRRYSTTSSRARDVSANISTGCIPRGRRESTTPVTTRPKNGSAKTWAVKDPRPAAPSSSGSAPAPDTTRATASVRRVTRERAARLGA